MYQSVLAIKNAAQSFLRPGIKKSDYEKLVRIRTHEELIKLGLASENTLIWSSISRSQVHTSEKNALQTSTKDISRTYFPHSASHFLGLDVHDSGSKEEIFREGMTITCEPGIYIPEEGIGIRLEDDILITKDGCENLSQCIPIECFLLW